MRKHSLCPNQEIVIDAVHRLQLADLSEAALVASFEEVRSSSGIRIS